MRRQRPRRCEVCHVDATWAWQEIVQSATVKRDGRVIRGSYPVHVYYCDDHVDAGVSAVAS
jgi:hypothetical protein